MLLNSRYILIAIYSLLLSNESKDDLFYNYYILNGSPKSIEFNHILESNYEYKLIHELEVDGITKGGSNNNEKFLNNYYSQYRKENIRFINAIVEPDVFYLSGVIGATNIIAGDNNYSFGKTIGFHIDSPYAFKLLKKTVVLGLKSSFISLPPLDNSNWDNFTSINMSSTYSMKFGKRVYVLTGLGAAFNSNNSKSGISPLILLDLAYELPWKPLNIPFDITFCGSGSWDLKNTYVGFNILLCKSFRAKF